jgi:hypothetical protein
LELRVDGVVVPRPVALGVPDVSPVGPERGSGREEVLGLLDELNPAAAVDVEEPELPWLEDDVPHRHHQIFPVGGPLGGLQRLVTQLGDLPRLLRIHVLDPEILSAVAIGGEGDPLPVGREAGLAVECHPSRDRGGGPAGDRNGVKIAEEVEDDCPAVRRDVDRNP